MPKKPSKLKKDKGTKIPLPWWIPSVKAMKGSQPINRSTGESASTNEPVMSPVSFINRKKPRMRIN